MVSWRRMLKCFRIERHMKMGNTNKSDGDRLQWIKAGDKVQLVGANQGTDLLPWGTATHKQPN